MDPVVHFEIPVDDQERAKKFYKGVFGWKTEDMPQMNYIIVRTTESDKDGVPKKPGMINGGMRKRNMKGEGPVIVMAVGSIEDTMKKIKANGGKAMGDKMTVEGMGFYQMCYDCENNLIGIFQPTEM